MKDASLALMKSLIATLKADAGVVALVSTRTFGATPDDGTTYPFISLGPMDAVPFHRGDVRGTSCTVQIDCWAQSRDAARDHMKSVREIIAAVVTAVGNTTPTISGWTVHQFWIEQTRSFEDEGLVGHGVVTIRCDLHPD